MSDHNKHAVVEDVLSSVRRLVSEDKRPLQSHSSEREDAPSAERLVLTPALRVADGDDTDATPQPVAEESPVDELGALLAENDGVSDQVADLDEMHLSPTDVHPADQDDHEDAQRIRARPNADGDTLEPDVADTALLLTDPALPIADTGSVSDAVEAAQGEDASEALETSALSAKIAALETAIADIPDAWDPDTEGQDAYAGSQQDAMVWEDIDEASAPDTVAATTVEESKAEGVQTPTATVQTDSDHAQDTDDTHDSKRGYNADHSNDSEAGDDAGFSMPGDDQLLDEDTLREMIGKIVHEELQGALGERITRNVRRLVRREIHRALTARDLD